MCFYINILTGAKASLKVFTGYLLVKAVAGKFHLKELHSRSAWVPSCMENCHECLQGSVYFYSKSVFSVCISSKVQLYVGFGLDGYYWATLDHTGFPA